MGTSAQPPQIETYASGTYSNAHVGNDGGRFNPLHNEINVTVAAGNTNVQVQPAPLLPPIQTIGVGVNTNHPDQHHRAEIEVQGNFDYPHQSDMK